LVYFHLERYDRAISDFRDAIARAPAHAKAHTGLGSTYAMVAEYELSVECYEEAIRVDPGHEEAHAGLRAIRAFLGNSGGEAKDLGPPPK
jgi:tetratricopeptide (TPR) repeat protein